MIPNPGTGVWVEFEQGDADHPIWTGCWYGIAAEVPALAHAAPPVTPPIVFQTQGQTTLMLSDVPGPTGGILLKTHDRRDDLDQRRRHHDLQRQGRDRSP